MDLATSSDDDESRTRAGKRRRVSRRHFATGAGCYTCATPFYFPDGDIVLKVKVHIFLGVTGYAASPGLTAPDASQEWQFFRIHRERLSYSQVFADMLDIPQPPEADMHDGCAVVELYDDARDWMATLRWMYDPSVLTTNPGLVTFDVLAGCLRISTKYDIPALREWGICEMHRRWPPNVEDINSGISFPHAAEAINLAREVDVPDVLPAAFYSLSLQKWRASSEGGRSHMILSLHDLRRLIVGREALEEVTLGMLQNPLPSEDRVCSACTPGLERLWREALGPEPDMPWVHGCWLLRALRSLTNWTPPSGDAQVCAGCADYSASLAHVRLREVKRRMAQWFLLE
ncbi:hypothetical protein PUNSTDRAFT_145651 [Punctularia strigosozonata HHB-11173 SS5]|uniref:uncharacterized protein n=1 Tax=Punctularia strigosozonata (strain HHB-11173) TaxID=741275 RepID=UPI000441841F|nr:uncharacterized protein PUNSTDRAFT_145651 [Punctularia strigosozonata HHB-11173 SS5]EIN05696.1 hypothetical protein PUNSTDRAFT_145651 [Punctularia strigosozonata HHB-11173 SS5]